MGGAPAGAQGRCLERSAGRGEDRTGLRFPGQGEHLRGDVHLDAQVRVHSAVRAYNGRHRAQVPEGRAVPPVVEHADLRARGRRWAGRRMRAARPVRIRKRRPTQAGAAAHLAVALLRERAPHLAHLRDARACQLPHISTSQPAQIRKRWTVHTARRGSAGRHAQGRRSARLAVAAARIVPMPLLQEAAVPAQRLLGGVAGERVERLRRVHDRAVRHPRAANHEGQVHARQHAHQRLVQRCSSRLLAHGPAGSLQACVQAPPAPREERGGASALPHVTT